MVRLTELKLRRFILMIRIKEYDELNDLIMKHFKKGVYTNCFVSKDEFEFFIEKKCLYYYLFDGGILLFFKMKGFYNMKFYINNINCDFNIPSNMKIVTEVAAKSPKDLLDVSDYLKRNGFQLELQRERFSCKEPIYEKKECGKNVDIAKLKDYKKIIKILKKNYDKYTGCIPMKEKIKDDIENGNFYCYRNGKNLIGILHINKKQKVSEMRHLVVLKKYRGNKVSKELIKKYLFDTELQSKQVWTSVDNLVAKKLFVSFGYKADGYVSEVLKRGC
jgi:N-acetylglutamate synthase-like GNAT family acetyltransferase